MFPRLAAAALLGSALLPAVADAAPRHRPLSRGPAVRIAWPLRSKQMTLAPGATLKVVVRSLRADSPRVTVTLARTAGGSVVKRRALREGTFSVTLPRAAGARYVLSAKIGRRTQRRATIVTEKAPPRRTAPTPAPADRCAPTAGRTAAATLTGERTTFTAGSFTTPGELVTATLTNTGSACLTGGVGYTVEALVGIAWQPLSLPLVFPAVAVIVEPGATRQLTWAIGGNPPGTYRIRQSWSSAVGPVEVAWEFRIVSPPPPPKPVERCGEPDSAAAATFTLDRTTATAGDELVVTIRNTGPVCLMGRHFNVHRKLPDGTLERIIEASPDAAPYDLRYEPGQSRSFRLPVLSADRMPPGLYVATTTLYIPPATDEITTLAIPPVEFEVVG